MALNLLKLKSNASGIPIS